MTESTVWDETSHFHRGILVPALKISHPSGSQHEHNKPNAGTLKSVHALTIQYSSTARIYIIPNNTEHITQLTPRIRALLEKPPIVQLL
jgi:hypothetical protein